MAAPVWSDAISILPGQLVAAGATARGMFNVKNLFGGEIFIRAMRLSSSAPSNGIYIAVRRILKGTPFGGGAGVDITHPAPLQAFQDTTTASNLTTLAAAPTIPGSSVSLASGTGFLGNQQCGITNSVTAPTVLEFCRTSKIATTTLTLDRNLTNTGLASGDTITNNALILPPIWVDGAPDTAEIEVIFDNGLESTVAYAIECWGQTLNSIA